MFIQTEQTPNPATLKFLPGKPVMESGVADFTDADQAAAQSPLAGRLFEVDGVCGVFYGADFITITKTDGAEWQVLRPLVLGAIMDHFTSGAALMRDGASEEIEEMGDGGADPEIIDQIKELLDTRVRPAVAQDGGDIVYKGFKDGTVYLHMRGACAGCPSSTMTLKMGIENMLRHYVPEVTQVEAVM
jgi:Fe-S cluster biogenesis protein NfuA